MMAAQLEHVGLTPAWELIEEQLFATQPRELECSSALGLRMRLNSAGLHLKFPSFAAFACTHPALGEVEALDDYLGRVHEFRQLQALFAAHGMTPKVMGASETEGFVIEARDAGPSVRYRLHTHPALGALAWTGSNATGQVVEQRYPLFPAAIERFMRELHAHAIPFEAARVSLTADGRDLAGSSPGQASDESSGDGCQSSISVPSGSST